jgi:hypothetical protein
MNTNLGQMERNQVLFGNGNKKIILVVNNL